MSSPPPAPAPAAPDAAAPPTGGGGGARADRSRNRIQVSREKRPLSFFIGLAKKFLADEDEVELSGLGLAVTTVVTVCEILRAAGQVEVARIETSLVELAAGDAGGAAAGPGGADARRDGRGSTPKAKIQIWVRKGPAFGTGGGGGEAAAKGGGGGEAAAKGGAAAAGTEAAAANGTR